MRELNKIASWANSAKVGECLVYATRSASGMPVPCLALDEARQAHSLGLVFLAQRRQADGGWFYEATRLSPATAVRLNNISAALFNGRRGL